MRFSPSTHIADVRYLARRMACCDMADVWSRARTYGQCAARKPYFHQMSHSSCFPCFSGIMTNRRFSTDLENPDLSEFSETLIDSGEF
jgi:hypothetical protein